MNATPQCYDYKVGSPGWSFFYSNEALPDDQPGIAQLSNRRLIPPNALQFQDQPNGGFLGYTWMALPFTDPMTGDPPTGGQSWTCFLNAANFKGPFACYIPEMLSKTGKLFNYSVLHGRGLDARACSMGGGAVEINTVPRFDSKDGQGTACTTLPRRGIGSWTSRPSSNTTGVGRRKRSCKVWWRNCMRPGHCTATIWPRPPDGNWRRPIPLCSSPRLPGRRRATFPSSPGKLRTTEPAALYLIYETPQFIPRSPVAGSTDSPLCRKLQCRRRHENPARLHLRRSVEHGRFGFQSEGHQPFSTVCRIGHAAG